MMAKNLLLNKKIPTYLICLLLGFFINLSFGQKSERHQQHNYSNKSTDVRPNIIILLSDDQRFDGFSLAGNAIIKTPELNKLAMEGSYFVNGFVTTPICAVSRASILTGQYASTHQVNDFSTGVQLNSTYPRILKDNGYFTGFIGKWGVNDEDDEYFNQVISMFDYWGGSTHQANYWHQKSCNYVKNTGVIDKKNFKCNCPPDSRGVEGEGIRIGKENLKNPIHLTTEIIPEKVESFLSQVEDEKPFCLSVSFKAPHGPWRDYDERFKENYIGDNMPLSKSVDYNHAKSRPLFLQNSLNGDLKKIQDKSVNGNLQNSIRNYYRLIEGIDFSIGKIRILLNEYGVADNTIIIFLSDNGMFLGEHGFRGKWLLYEESIRVPIIIYDPTVVNSHVVSTVDEMVSNIDIAPTILKYAGINEIRQMDGLPLQPLVIKKPSQKWNRNELFFEHHFTNGSGKNHIEPSRAIRTKNWKYINYYNQNDKKSEELYWIGKDHFELQDLSGNPNFSDTLQVMRNKYDNFFQNQ